MIRLSVTVEAGRIDLDKRLLRQTLRAAGAEVVGVARTLVRKSQGSGRLYRGKRSSAPGQPPISRSGDLARSFKVSVFKSGEGVAIRDAAFYARFLETGARGGGGASRTRTNILLAGQVGRRGRILRLKNRMKRGAVNKTRVLMPRPFLTTALQMREASIAQRVAVSINTGIKFVRQKP